MQVLPMVPGLTLRRVYPARAVFRALYVEALDLHIILDNLSAHKTPAVREWLEANPRVHLHFTPTSSSWLNAVEGWFAQLERRALYRGVFTSVPILKAEL